MNSRKPVNLLLFILHFQFHHHTPLYVIFFAWKLNSLLPSGLQPDHLFIIKSHMCPSRWFTPWRCLDLYFFPIWFFKLHFEPNSESVGIAISWCSNDKVFPDVVNLLIRHIHDLVVNKPCCFTHDKSRIHDPNNWLMRNPFLHRFHWYAIHLIPKLYFLIYEILISNECAFIFNFVGKDKSFIFVTHM